LYVYGPLPDSVKFVSVRFACSAPVTFTVSVASRSSVSTLTFTSCPDGFVTLNDETVGSTVSLLVEPRVTKPLGFSLPVSSTDLASTSTVSVPSASPDASIPEMVVVVLAVSADALAVTVLPF